MGPRRRSIILVLLISLGLLFYFSFYAAPNPVVSPAYHPSPSNDDSTSTRRPTILLVSAFFPLSNSKHSISDYENWLSRFLQPITTPIYFFTTPAMEPFIKSLRGANLPITVNTTFSSPFDIPPLQDSIGTKEKYNEMWAWDREKDIRSSELYATWTAKPYFLDEGLRNSRNAYDYAFWTDAGSFRDPHSYTLWPDPIRIREVWEEGSKGSGTSVDELLFFPMWGLPHSSMKFWSEDIGPVNSDSAFSEGSFFGGSAHTIKWWRSLFFKYHDYYLSRGLFVGEDQILFDMLFLLHPRRIISVWQYDPTPTPPPPPPPALDTILPSNQSQSQSQSIEWGDINTPLGACGSTWYYYQFFLASQPERDTMKAKWGGGSAACRLTRVIGMEAVLKRAFGSTWVPPVSSFSA